MVDQGYNYGYCPPKKTYAVDQVPLEFGGRGQTHNDIGTGECFMRGSKHNMEKRQASLQLCVRAEHPQKNYHYYTIYKLRRDKL